MRGRLVGLCALAAWGRVPEDDGCVFGGVCVDLVAEFWVVVGAMCLWVGMCVCKAVSYSPAGRLRNVRCSMALIRNASG